jgi:hypothetical protein
MTKINFTGNIDDIKKQVEQTVATFELLGNRSSTNFEQWFNKWELGFPAAVENRTLGNYQLSGDNIWRGDASKRSRWRQWETENGIITGEYWRDRSIENKSVVLSGTSEMLISYIVELEYKKNEIQKEKDTEYTGGGEVKRKGKPRLYIFFTEDEADIEPGYDPIEGKISMRLMDKSAVSISRTNMSQYKNKIESVFGTQGGKIWRRGKDMAIYCDWEKGYQLQLLVRNRSDGESLIKDFLAIQNVEFQRKKYFYNENQDPIAAYPIDPGEITILGKKIKKQRERPIAEVRFQSAWISLSEKSKPIYLVDYSQANATFFD